MRITVLGATGGTGRHVVDQALNAGHRVTALVRDPARLPVTHERLETVRMPAPEPDRLRSLLSETDAVVSALAASAKGGFPATTWTEAVLAALEDGRTTRLAVVSASPVGPKEPGGPLPQRLLMPLIGRLFRDVYLDLGRMEAALEASGAAWTVVRPPQLTDAPATGEYRLALDRNVPSGYRISRADLAHALLRVLDGPAAVRRAVGIAD